MMTLEQQVKDRRQKWSQGVFPTDVISANEYIEFKLLENEYFDFKDRDLWDQFKEDFTGFTEEILKACHQPTIYKLRTFLRDHGVWVLEHKNTSVAKSLSNTIKEEDYIRHTRIELLDHRSLSPRFSYLLQNDKKTIPQANQS